MTAGVGTLRDQTLDAIAAVIAGLTGWTAARRFPGANVEGGSAKAAWVTHGGETVIADDDLTTTKELHVRILVAVRVEQLADTAAGNPDRALDFAVGELEVALFGGAQPPEPAEVFLQDSWDPIDEPQSEQETTARAVLKFRSRYRHNRGDPSTFNPFYTG